MTTNGKFGVELALLFHGNTHFYGNASISVQLNILKCQ